MSKSTTIYRVCSLFFICFVKMQFPANIFTQWALVIASMAFCVANVEHKIQFVSDFVANEHSPFAISVKASCWTRSTMVYFAKRTPTSVEFIVSADSMSNFPVKEIANKSLFFIDMTCDDSVQFLFQVSEHSKFIYSRLYRFDRSLQIFNLLLFLIRISRVLMTAHKNKSSIRRTNHILRFHIIGFYSMYR